ncbi:MAG TPA: hypothetical protein VGM03_23055 [Phycisphaerae bacterium]
MVTWRGIVSLLRERILSLRRTSYEIDLDILRQNAGACQCCAADLDGDGDVDTPDEAIILANWTG